MQFDSINLTQADIKLSTRARPAMLPEKQHDALLAYLQQRLASDNTNRNARIRRYATIDKSVSTWQQLSTEDTNRANKQKATGEAQAININLPIQHTHMDDMVSFFCGVYAPNSGMFYEEPNDDSEDTEARLKAVKTMNGDAKKNKYFKNLMLAMRSLFKYNLGGFRVEWSPGNDETNASNGSNILESLDMYNFFWDPTIDDPSDIPEKAEWAAYAERVNRMHVVRGEQSEYYKGVGIALGYNESNVSNGNVAAWYKFPPNDAGLNASGADGTSSRGSRADWASYGASMPGESTEVLNDAHELVHMYCWLNPRQFNLRPAEVTFTKDEYALFRFTIMDNKRIIRIEVVQLDDENPTTSAFPVKIPFFLGFLNQDDMGVAQRSVAELLNPFQMYGSFLLNAHVAGSRSNIWGLQVYDPSVIDLGNVEPSTTSTRVASKKAGVDLRSALQTVNGNAQTGQAMDDLGKLMALIDRFFPGQALPSQIAGMDRAVKAQVAAVLQGVNRRLHMLVRVIDDDILGPTRKEQVLNMIRNGSDAFSGMSETDIMNFIGSGLAQLNREVAAEAMQQLLFALIQNPEAAGEYDIGKIMVYWSRMMNMDVSLESFKKSAGALPNPGQAPTGAPTGAPVAQPVA